MQYTAILVGIVLIPPFFLVRERLPVRELQCKVDGPDSVFPMELPFLRDWIISDDVCTSFIFIYIYLTQFVRDD